MRGAVSTALEAASTFTDSFGSAVVPSFEIETSSKAEEGPERHWGSAGLSLQTDPMTGALLATLPLGLQPGRIGLPVEHSLRYRSGDGNGAFGLGWSIDVPFISDDRGVLKLDGDELVPALLSKPGTGWTSDQSTVGEYLVERFRRRRETTRDRIERWTHQSNGHTHWKVTDKANVTSLFGTGDSSRIGDRSQPGLTGAWLLVERFDDRGNIVQYDYKTEDLEGIHFDVAYERHRMGIENPQGAWRYLKRISYGNSAPHSRDSFHFYVVFDYGDHDTDHPTIDPSQSWDVRPDPFSNARMGFENRQWRRAKRILTFHRFNELGNAPALVSSLLFGFDDNSQYSLLSTVTRTGFIDRGESTDLESASCAPISIGYDKVKPDETVHELHSDVLLNTLSNSKAPVGWMDLHREGLPGVISPRDDTWFYVRNLGRGKFADPEAIASVVEGEIDQSLLDLSFNEPQSSVSHESEYIPTTTFRTSSDVNEDDRYVGHIALSREDAEDVIVADEETLRWYRSQGESGFADAIVVKLDPLGHALAHRLHFERTQSFHVADMTGDGLLDLVRVRANDISYWPSRGQGRFGARVQMVNPPALPEDAGRRTFMIDMSGTGNADLVSIGDGEFTLWENASGNGWGSPQVITAPGLHPDSRGLSVLDLFADGTGSVIWVDQSSAPIQLRHITPFRNRNLRLLNSVANGQGLESRIDYAPSIESWLTDRENGGYWLNTIPYSITVVHKVEERDSITGSRRMAKFAYHHGHYDEDRQRFNGFAFIERTDGGTKDDYANVGLFADREVPHFEKWQIPAPIHTKTWRHTGTLFEDTELTSALRDEFFEDKVHGRSRWLTGPQMPTAQQEREILLSNEAQLGRLLRRESYALDGPPLEATPFVVEESTAWVRQLQPSRGSTAAAYGVVDFETLRVVYERNTANPRVHHCVNLSLSEFGYVSQSACVDYGPRQALHDAQAKTNVVVHEYSYHANIESPSVYRLDVPIEHRTWLLAPVSDVKTDRLYEPRQIRAAFEEQGSVDPVVATLDEDDNSSRRLIKQKRWRYWSNDGRRLLPIGVVESRALLAREEDLALSSNGVGAIYGKSALEPLRFEGGYFVDGDLWWAPGPTIAYDASLFYLPVNRLDALGREIRQTWDDAGLFVLRREDGFGNANLYEWHPRTLKVWRHADLNGNITAYRFTPIGDVLSVTVVGSEANPTGDSVVPTSLESSRGDNPTVVFTYDYSAWLERREPVSIRQRHRLTHGGRPTGLQDSIANRDGRGNIVSVACRNAGNWNIGATVLHDAHGRVSGRLLPVISEVPSVSLTDRDLPTETWLLDGLNRETRHDFADGTFTLSEYEAWKVTRHDASDTVLDSRWYADRSSAGRGRAGDFAKRQAAGAIEATRAAAMSASHARTPKTELLDFAGRVIVTQEQIAVGAIAQEIFEYNHDSTVRSIVDARGLRTKFYVRDLLGRVIVEDSLDSGKVVTSWSATGEELQHIDAGKRRVRRRYDTAGRLTHILVGHVGEPDVVAERFIWGGGDVAVLHPNERNLNGRLHMRFSALGLETFHNYDVHGICEKTTLKTLVGPEQLVDWSKINDVSHVEQLLVLLPTVSQPKLSDEEELLFCQTDARGAVTATRGFNRVQLQYSYRAADGEIDNVRLSADGEFGRHEVITKVDYSANQTPTQFNLGNGVEVVRNIDAANRVTSITASAADRVIQELLVTYDSRGNTMSVSEHHELKDAFSYDGLSRLIGAEGNFEGERHARRFELDLAGNLIEVSDIGGKDETLVSYEVSPNSNHLISATDSDGKIVDYRFDPAGNLVSGGGVQLSWDYNGNLVGVANGSTVSYAYGIDGSLRRRTLTRDDVIEDTVFMGPFARHRVITGGQVTTETYRAVVNVDGTPLVSGERVLIGESADAVRYMLSDHLKAVTHVLDEAAQIVETIARNELRPSFKAGELDTATRYLRVGRRWFSPKEGRWISAL